jgi:uncharacterized protein (TIGR02266 family)
MDVPTAEGVPRNGRARRTARFDFEVPVRFRGRRGAGSGVTKNICAGGLFVATLRSLPVGDRIVVKLTFPGDGGPIEVLGEVRWSRTFQELDDRPAGLGLRFIDTPVRAAIHPARSAGLRTPQS